MFQKLAYKLVPPLSPKLHKGQAGRIAVVGGSLEYTGAPYYASISSLKAGADLAFVICSQRASLIKAYSPEIIVYPILQDKEHLLKNCLKMEEVKRKLIESLKEMLPRFNTIVIGPGLGRDQIMLDCAKLVIEEAKKRDIPMVLDGDAIFLLCQNPSIISGYVKSILTPNIAEYKRLCEAVLGKQEYEQLMSQGEDLNVLKKLCTKLGNVTIVRKGNVDYICNGISLHLMGKQYDYLNCDEKGGHRRCGGIGDILAGTLGTFLNWAQLATVKRAQLEPNSEEEFPWLHHSNKADSDDVKMAKTMLIAAYGACQLTRCSTRLAFQKHKRATTAPDIIAEIGLAFESLYPLIEQTE